MWVCVGSDNKEIYIETIVLRYFRCMFGERGIMSLMGALMRVPLIRPKKCAHTVRDGASALEIARAAEKA